MNIAEMITEAPPWLILAAGAKKERDENRQEPLTEPDTDSAIKRAVEYLKTAEPALMHSGGNQRIYVVSCKVRDFGVSEGIAFGLMLDYWYPRCEPNNRFESLERTVAHAYEYANERMGVENPAADFDVVESNSEEDEADHPLVELNKNHAFVVAGNNHHVLWETVDADGLYQLRHITEQTFHAQNKAIKINTGERSVPLTKMWMEWADRRSYDGICFRPGRVAPPRWYNLWKGFAYEPALDEPTGKNLEALEMFQEHILENVCHGSTSLYRWIIGYFSHLIQHPGEKPLVSLVFKGAKGTGKNAMVERIGALLGHHFMVTSNRRFIVGNFNGHMENLLLFALDEAFWSGDKQAEGQLKDLITGGHHVIEHKGQEPYRVENLTRVVIIGNEEWLVPATADERRFAVFHVGDGRKQDKEFFHSMRIQMEQGGYPYLLKYLLDPEHLVGVDINQAPDTAALRDQKLESLTPVARWWFDCLQSERILGLDFSKSWPEKVQTTEMRDSMAKYMRQHRISGWSPNEWQFGKDMSSISVLKKKRLTEGGEREYYYMLQDLAAARDKFCQYIGHNVEW